MAAYLSEFGIFVGLFLVFMHFNTQTHDDVFKQIKKINNGENRFKNIFENLEEPVIVLEGQQGKYANESFLRRFKHFILGAEVALVRTEQHLTLFQKVKKKFFSTQTEHQFTSSFYGKEIFRFENGEASLFSILEILKQDKEYFKGKKFVISVSNRECEQKSYIQIKMTRYEEDGNSITMLQFTDISASVFYDQTLAENKLLERINACVSHELRNPLNSIVA